MAGALTLAVLATLVVNVTVLLYTIQYLTVPPVSTLNSVLSTSEATVSQPAAKSVDIPSQWPPAPIAYPTKTLEQVLTHFRMRPFQTLKDHDSMLNVATASSETHRLLSEFTHETRKNIFGCSWCTCAVVGASPIVTGKAQGPEIDSKDIVIRFNHHKYGGQLTEDLGAKCTMDMSWTPDAKTNNCDLRLYSHFLDGFNWSKLHATDSYVYLVNRGLFDAVEDLTGKHRASSGALGIILASVLCDDIDIYGFDFFACARPGGEGKAMYYKGAGGGGCVASAHNGTLEEGLVSQLREIVAERVTREIKLFNSHK